MTEKIMTDQEKLSLAAENYLLLEKKFEIAMECLRGINEDHHVQMGVQCRVYDCLDKIEGVFEKPRVVRKCDDCYDEFIPVNKNDERCDECERDFKDFLDDHEE